MNMNRKRLVIVGSGFAGFRLLKGLDTGAYDTTLISPRNHFLFTPLLTSTTVGTLEFRSIVEPVRGARPGASFIQASCRSVNPASGTVLCIDTESGREFPLGYDLLVIAVGGTNSTFGVPGVTEHAFFLKELQDARAVRQRIIARLEQANLPATSEAEKAALLHFVIVGGGPTGVEFAAELYDFLHQDVRRWFPDLAPLVRISLFEASNQILSSFDHELSSYTLRLFGKRHIEVRTGTPVVEVTAEHLVLRSGERIPYGLIVWSTGITPTDFAAQLPFEKDGRGRIIVDERLRVAGYENIFAAGDCAVLRDTPLPATAQVAQQQGKYLAQALNHLARQSSPPPFRYRNFGMLAYVGDSRALANLENIKWSGFTAWLFWRSVYLTKLVSIRNKVLVLFDWFKTRLFGRDISRF